MESGIYAHINWYTRKVILTERLILFCFGELYLREKCMTGKIETLKQITDSHEFEFEIKVTFIEPDYFREEGVIGKNFSIREASIILGEGIVTQIW